MESYSYSSGGEKFNIKTRKPYTITKQRERWTEDEHNSFLEALKLYGRAWQRIEEHIGTKTAVQIRSHAQKFFTKLEKEALAKGVPMKQALDIEIPPPRPKRKPNYPYPRKTDPLDGKQATLASSLQLLDLETKPLPETTSHQEKLENGKTSDQGENGGTQVPSLSQENATPCASLSSDNENSVPRSNPGVFREDVINHGDETDESYITIETRKHLKLDQDGIRKHTNNKSNTSLFESGRSDNLSQPGNFGALSLNDLRGVHNYPRHVPVQVVDGITGKKSVPPEMTFHESSSLNKSGVVHNNASRSSSYQTVANFHPLFTPFCDNQENYASFLHISSLIVSSLVQNPAAHAAASFAATFWHPPNKEASSGDSILRDHVNPETPSMAAIAAATVAAATAWWAAHGLLPACTPFYPPFSSGTQIDGNQARVAINGGRDKAPLEGEGALVEEKMEKTAHLSSSEDSDEKLNAQVRPLVEMVPVVDETMTNVRKQVDRSSCGSNTASSSEIETDALEKHGKEKEETKGPDVNDSLSRRSRSTIISPNESWKEVSEEGRLAFQALFSREVLPQSFSDTRRDQENIINNSQLDLNRMSQIAGECNGFAHLRGEKSVEEGLLRMGLASVKLNVHHTGFKPYKRCSIEANESSKTASTGSQNDEKGPKRMRLEAEAST